jgi:hypothetical protein
MLDITNILLYEQELKDVIDGRNKFPDPSVGLTINNV